MPIYRLAQISQDNAHAGRTIHPGPLILRAGEPAEARTYAASCLDQAASRSPYRDTPLNPWLYDDLSTCEEILDPNHEPDGPTQILEPAGYDMEKRNGKDL